MNIDIPINALAAMVLVLAVLVVASATCMILRSRKPEGNFVELNQRINSWWWMIGILFLVLSIGGTIAIVFFAMISFLALKEFLSIVPTRLSDRRVIFWAYLSIPVQYYFIAIEWYTMFLIFIPVYVLLFLPTRMVLLGNTDGFIRSAGVTHWGVMLTVFCLSHIAYLFSLPVKNEAAGQIGLVLFLLLMTQLNDVAQYVWGKMLGKRKIIPKVSPNKTWEGFLGGLLTIVCVCGFLAPYLTPLTLAQGFTAGLLISCAGFIGDVVISSVKRDLQIKDSGTLIPGHGGLLDRLDSLTYTAPLFFHFVYYLSY